MEKKYDVIVIGSGGGTKIITPAARRGLKVACIDKGPLGGTCLNRGCIPSKMLIHPADVTHYIQDAPKFDIISHTNFRVDFEKLIRRISYTVDRDSAGIAAGYDRNPNIDSYNASARFLSDKVIEVAGHQLTADKIFIAVGARPRIPDIAGLEGTPYMTSTEALRNMNMPRNMVVVGAGYIAAELGYAYGALGAAVHFLVRSKFLRSEDSQIAEEFSRIFSQRFSVHFSTVPTEVKYNNQQFTVSYKDRMGRVLALTTDALLIATGVVPNTDTLALENTNIARQENGFIKVDNRLQTTVDGIYALGDCVGNYLYRHSVNFEGEYLFRTVFDKPSNEPIQYPPMPHAIFTRPQVAGVGKTEDQLKEEGVDYVVGINPYTKSAMGMAMLSEYGFCKILIDRKSRRILGGHIIGDEASNMIHMIIAFMNKEGTLDDLLNMIYIHPALPEIVRNAARNAKTNLEAAAKKPA